MSSRPGLAAAQIRELTKLSVRRVSPAKARRQSRSSLAALMAGVEAIGAPAFIIETSGRVLHANSRGRSLLARDPTTIELSLAGSIIGASNDLGWELIPLSGHDSARRFLAILNASPRIAPAIFCVHAASTRWRLTSRQTQVLDLVARGLTNADIGRELAIGVTTVEFHVAAIFDKAGVDNRATLIARLHDV